MSPADILLMGSPHVLQRGGITHHLNHDVLDDAVEPLIPFDYLGFYERLTAIDTYTPESRTPADVHGEMDMDMSTDHSSGDGDTPATAEGDAPDEVADADTDSDPDTAGTETATGGDDPVGSADAGEAADGGFLADVEDDLERIINELAFDPQTVMTELSDVFIENSDTLDDDSDLTDVAIDEQAVASQFGGKEPTESDFWENLPGALRYGVSIRGTQADDAVRVGIAAGELYIST